MDAQGPDVARRFTERAGARFMTAVDRAQGLWKLYGFDVIPNGFFIDEQGILRYVKIGGFDVRDLEDAQAVEKLLASPPAGGPAASIPAPRLTSVKEALALAETEAARDPEDLEKLLTLAERRIEARQHGEARRDFETALEKDPKSVRALVGLATVNLDEGKREEAVTALRKAWALDPNNWIIRKQIWAIEHPDQFYPAINTDWQNERIRQEDSERR